MTATPLPPRVWQLDELLAALAPLRAARKTIVFTNGVFDLPHPGHVHSLRAARAHGDVLVVGVNSDDSVRRGKGPDRPVISEGERAKILASFEMVDFVTIFREDTPLEIVKAIQPDVIAKGADYRGREVVGSEVVLARGGRVEYLPIYEGISSTAIVDRIVQAHK